jgi:hypothetical protein
MARCLGVENRHSGTGAVDAVRRLVLATVRRERFREGLIGGLKLRGATDQGVFREVRLAGLPPDAARGVCAVLPGGLRIDGLDVAGAAALARILG